MGYDALRRLSTVTGGIYTKRYTYRDVNSSRTTSQVASVVYDLPTDQTFAYTYDNMGNIATYTDANGTVTYTYDALGQLTKAAGSTTYNYTYDSAGNILTGNGHSYTYGDTGGWKDLLTKVDGHTISYDSIGNPTSYYNGTDWTFTWAEGRRLATASGGGNSISYTYDADGLRTSKTVNGTKHTYYYAGGKLLRETYGSNTLDFFYDSNGHAYALNHNGTVYYYITNLQGDVMSIVDAGGNVKATYKYDPYGNVLTATGTMAEVNPLRYRGYYYDADSQLYYLQSRYYDPELSRFLNADAFASTGQGLLGMNMFAYCNNSPCTRVDLSGGASTVCFDYESDPFSSPYEDAGGSGGISSASAILGAMFVAAVIASSSRLDRSQVEQVALEGNSSVGIYSVYFLADINGDGSSVVYVGRVKTMNLDTRMAYHLKQNRKLVGAIHGLDYAMCRVMEQAGMMYHHTINRNNPINNQIRGIRPNNKNLYSYLAAVYDLINRDKYPHSSFLPLSYWDNFCENEFLNLGA